MINKEYERWVSQFELELGRDLKDKEKHLVYWMCDQEKKSNIS
ncbi:hypothetical protein ACKXGF_12950 [Alkalibacillus sp. S2W]|nr:hypothetical protein [Alkalibacillus almallahensis]NIK11901.1 hypothetical protein [Alkalibacillus almallahensis]